MLRRKRDEFRVDGFVERLAPYGSSVLRVVVMHDVDEPALVERAAALIAVLPSNQRRETIEQLLSPHDTERARRAVDALIDTDYAVEDDLGRLRKVA